MWYWSRLSNCGWLRLESLNWRRKCWYCSSLFSYGDSSSKPQAILERFDRKTCDCEAQVGHGVQRVSGLCGLIHESPVSKHRGVRGWIFHWEFRRGSYQVQ